MFFKGMYIGGSISVVLWGVSFILFYLSLIQ